MKAFTNEFFEINRYHEETDEGKIVEQGTHDELLSNEHGLYKTLTELQFTT